MAAEASTSAMAATTEATTTPMKVPTAAATPAKASTPTKAAAATVPAAMVQVAMAIATASARPTKAKAITSLLPTHPAAFLVARPTATTQGAIEAIAVGRLEAAATPASRIAAVLTTLDLSRPAEPETPSGRIPTTPLPTSPVPDLGRQAVTALEDLGPALAIQVEKASLHFSRKSRRGRRRSRRLPKKQKNYK